MHLNLAPQRKNRWCL